MVPSKQPDLPDPRPLLRLSEYGWDRVRVRLGLSPRQTEVLRHLHAGLSVKAMAALMGCKTDTVRTHRRRLYSNLGVHSAIEAVTITLPAVIDEAGSNQGV